MNPSSIPLCAKHRNFPLNALAENDPSLRRTRAKARSECHPASCCYLCHLVALLHKQTLLSFKCFSLSLPAIPTTIIFTFTGISDVCSAWMRRHYQAALHLLFLLLLRHADILRVVQQHPHIIGLEVDDTDALCALSCERARHSTLHAGNIEPSLGRFFHESCRAQL